MPQHQHCSFLMMRIKKRQKKQKKQKKPYLLFLARKTIMSDTIWIPSKELKVTLIQKLPWTNQVSFHHLFLIQSNFNFNNYIRLPAKYSTMPLICHPNILLTLQMQLILIQFTLITMM